MAGVWRWCLLLALSLACVARAEQAGPLLSEEQRAWLVEHRQWRVGVVLQAPYAQFDRRLQQYSGINVEVMQWLAQALAVELNWRGYASREALEAALRNGQVDVAPGLAQTPAGLRHGLFSDPYLRVPYLLVGELDGRNADLERLGAEQPLAVRMPGAVADFLRGNYSNLTLTPVRSERQAMRLVLERQARYAVVDAAQFSLFKRESEFASLVAVADVGLPQLLRIAARRDWQPLAEILDNSLRAWPDHERRSVQERWLKPAQPRLGESLRFWRNLAIFCIALASLGLLVGAVLRRRLRDSERRLSEARSLISQRQLAEEALRLAQFSIDQSSVGTLWVNWDSHVRYANRAAERMFGHGVGELVDRPLADFDPQLHIDRWLNLWRRARANQGEELRFESECRRADGSSLPVDVALSFLRFRSAEYLVVYLTDVTERRRARAALEESEARLKGIASNVPGLVFRLERPCAGVPADFAFIGEGSGTLVGYSASELLDSGRGIRGLVHPEDRDDYWASQMAALDADRDWHWQGRILTRDGAERWADIKAGARSLGNGRMVWDGVVWDITDNKRIELELGQSRARLRELSAHLESVREEEKARIAREVHDELGQVLTVLKLETSMCELGYGALDPGLQARLQSMKKLIGNLFQLVRDVATALRPPILEAGIGSAIEWQARRFEARTQISCLAQVPEHLPALPDAKATGLFRVLQEALTNVLRHAGAHSVELTLRLDGDTLELVIADDGRGFDPAAVSSNSFGLVGMRERVLMLDGELDIASSPGEGTTLTVRVPLGPIDKEKNT